MRIVMTKRCLQASALALWCLITNMLLALPLLVRSAIAAETAASSTGPDLSGVGRVLGMMLFAYLAMKLLNRKKDSDDSEQRGLLGMPVKPWVVWMVVIGGLVLLVVKSG